MRPSNRLRKWNRNHFEKSENFRLSLKKAAAFDFIKAAVEEYPDQEWNGL
jgi:hypothetical protein